MDDVSRILSAIEKGEPQAAERLLPLVYDELRRLAARRLSRERPGQTLQATDLVHEAYLRLIGAHDPGWNGRGHFFGAAAEAMRRILVEAARRKAGPKAGGHLGRVEMAQARHGRRLTSQRLDLFAPGPCATGLPVPGGGSADWGASCPREPGPELRNGASPSRGGDGGV